MKLKYYQLDSNAGGTWGPVHGETYACYDGDFRDLLDAVKLTPGQRLRVVETKSAKYLYDRVRRALIRWGR